MKRIISVFCVLVILVPSLCVFASAVETPYGDSEFFTKGDYEVHYRVIPQKGELKGRVMMLHGFLCSTYAWRNMAAGLSETGYECVLVDLPNFGYTTRETPETEIIDREELVMALMDKLAPGEKWILAGHSMGGGVVTNIAEERELEALLLFCPAPQSTAPVGTEKLLTSKPVRWMMNTFFKVGTRLGFLVKLVVFAATRNWDFSMKYDVHGVTDPFLYDGIGAGMCQMLLTVRPTDLENTGKITCPVLLVEADGDIIINDEMRKQFYTAFPEAETYLVKGGGHQCIEDRADELCALVLDFLSE